MVKRIEMFDLMNFISCIKKINFYMEFFALSIISLAIFSNLIVILKKFSVKRYISKDKSKKKKNVSSKVG